MGVQLWVPHGPPPSPGVPAGDPVACLCMSLTRQCRTSWAGKPGSHSEPPELGLSASDLEVCATQSRGGRGGRGRSPISLTAAVVTAGALALS